jgi:hypothetical protein
MVSFPVQGEENMGRKLVAVNGSPRKQWNTAQLLAKVVEGARAAGMDAKLVHLYDLDYGAYDSARFDPDAKMKRHREVFPQDLARAFELGKRMAEPPPAG